MIKEIPNISMPEWLSVNDFSFFLNNILQDSMYYPSSGMDGIPIQNFMGNIYSFIYVDYGINENDFNKEVEMENAFKGYRIIHKEKILEKQLDNGTIVKIEPKISDGRPPENWIQSPFCYWVVFERDINYGDMYNPKRFSLLFLCSEAVSAYYVLYNKNKIAPRILCILQDGSGFGGNWTRFTDRYMDLARAVFSNKNLPEYLINGGYQFGYKEPIWPEYTKRLFYKSYPNIFKKGELEKDAKTFALWGRNES
jgi:hypothetical protein